MIRHSLVDAWSAPGDDSGGPGGSLMSRAILAALCVGLILAAALLSQPRPDAPVPSVSVRAIGALQPRISPDGVRIAFSCQRSTWTIPAEGGTMTRLTSGEGLDIEPAWSADGKRIAYINSRNFFGGSLRIVNGENGSTVDLAASVQASGKLHWHPDGKRVLGSFSSPELKGESLAWFDLITGKLTPITDASRSVRRCGLSTDGRWIAFATNQDVAGQQGGNDGPQADLWKVSADGGKPEKIVQFAARIHDVCWSDERNLIVTTDVGGAHYDLWQIPLADPERGARRLTFGHADEDRPSVSRDGRRLLYTDNREGCTALVRRDLRSGAEQTLAVTGIDFRKPIGSIKLRVSDQKGPLVARVSLLDKSGNFHAPPGAMYRLDRSVGHFYCREATEFQLPAGEYRLAVARGPEYAVSRQTIQIEEGKSKEVPVKLERWLDAEPLRV